MSYQILVVDDEAHMRQLVRIYLTSAGYQVGEASDGVAALTELERSSYHLVVLDVMMPGMDGWEVCSRIRAATPELPILMLTARTAVEDRVAGLTMGADDYLTKPFDGRELIARVQSLLRRSYREDGALRFDELQLTVDPDGRSVLVCDRSVSLTPKEFEVLLLLAKRRGRTFSREELLERIWGQDYFGDTRTVDSHIKNLREKLRDAGVAKDPILTVWGIGYKFEVPN